VGIASHCDETNMSGLFAVLLTPIACPADINESGCVDTDDLLAVIGAWGDCDACTECAPDIDGLTCTVDVDDYLLVFASWCP
jgi:hypothetical protein